jgi:CubicO group peptidase (beta-lactamase class C family)
MRNAFLAGGLIALTLMGRVDIAWAQSADPRAAQADAFIARSLEALGVVPGIAVAVVVGDEVVFLTGQGVTDVRSGIPVDANTRFYIASSTKPMVALAIAAMDARGDVDLDAPVGVWSHAGLPADIAGAVTLTDLLSHRAGVENDALTFRLAYSGDHSASVRSDLVASTTRDADTPHGQFRYSNVGYNLATTLIEAESGLDWRDLVSREVLGPLGMTATTPWIEAERGRASVAAGHFGHLPGGPTVAVLQKTDQTMHSAGGLVASARDMARWLEIQLTDGVMDGERIFPVGLVASTHRSQVATDATFGPYTRVGYGLGWYVGRYGEQPLIHHFGNFGGSRAHVSFMPERGIGVVVLINEDAVAGGFADIVANYLYGLYGGRPDLDATFDAEVAALAGRIDSLRPRIAADIEARGARSWRLDHPMAAYIGVYESPSMGRVYIGSTGDGLVVSIGVMSATAEPFTAPNSLRVELIPLRGEVLTFGGTDQLTYGGVVFERRQP